VSANLSLATCGFPYATRFVLVNERVPRNDEHCALCGGTIEKGSQPSDALVYAIEDLNDGAIAHH
jgi:hypothetical protein